MAPDRGLCRLAAVAACSSGGSRSTPPPVASSTLSVALLADPPGANPAPRMLVAMPSASPVSMLLDTGSAGLRPLPSGLAAVPSTSYTNTGKPIAAVFGGDRVYYGTIGVAKAGVVIGGILRIDKPLNFQIISAVCAGVPSPVPTGEPANCDNITSRYEADLIGGVMGVRPQTTNAVLSPLAELPQPYSNGFVISAYGASPKLTVGATAANQTGFELYVVGSTTAADGSPGWTGNDELPWCYTVTVPGAAPVQGCPSTGALTDSGGKNEHLSLPVAPPGTLTPNTLATLPPSSTVVATLSEPNSIASGITWTLTAGNCTYYNAPNLYFSDPTASPTPAASTTTMPSSNAIEPFYTNDILFDLQGGTLGFRAVPAMTPLICS